MANVTVKVFGVYRVDSGVKEYECQAERVDEVFATLNSLSKVQPSNINYDSASVFINNAKCKKKKQKLKDGDEIWVMSPAGGG